MVDHAWWRHLEIPNGMIQQVSSGNSVFVPGTSFAQKQHCHSSQGDHSSVSIKGNDDATVQVES